MDTSRIIDHYHQSITMGFFLPISLVKRPYSVASVTDAGHGRYGHQAGGADWKEGKHSIPLGSIGPT